MKHATHAARNPSFLAQVEKLFEKGDAKGALALASGHLKQNPTGDLYILRGSIHYVLGKLDRAINDYKFAEKLTPDHPAIYSERGLAYLDMGKFIRAIKDFSKAIFLNPNDVTLHFSRGYAYLHEAYWDRAIRDFDRVLQAETDNADAWYYRGKAHICKKAFEEAIKDLSNAIHHKENLFDVGIADAYNDRGDSHEGLGNLDFAIEDYKSVLLLDPHNAHANTFLKWLQRKQKKIKTAQNQTRETAYNYKTGVGKTSSRYFHDTRVKI